MKIEETAAVMAKIKLGDNREVNPLVISEWHTTIGHLQFRDAVDAVTMFRQESDGYLTGANVIQNAARIRAERTKTDALDMYSDRETHPKPDNFEKMVEAAGDPTRWAAEIAKYNRQLADAGFPQVWA